MLTFNKDKIEKAVKNRPNLYYLYKVIKGFRNAELKTDILRLNECDLILNFRQFGKRYPEYNILYFYNDSNVRGFFSLFFLTLDALNLAEQYHLTPVLVWGKHTLYFQEEITETDNPFEYYFDQPTIISKQDVFEAARVMVFNDANRQADYYIPYTVASKMVSDIELAQEYIASRAILYKKYFHYKEEVQKYIDDNLKRVIGTGKTLGVHVRGTDFNKGYLNHAKAVSPKDYLEKTIEAKKQYGYDYIFLATDEEEVIHLYSNQFGNELKWYKDVFRSDDGTALHFSENGREKHKYKLGLEVLRDAFSLGSCDGLIAGFSNVSLAARVMKKAKGEEYLSCDILDNGFNTKGVRLKKHR